MRLAIPPPEALHQPAGRNLLSGGLLHERGRFEPSPVGMHMLPQPGEQSAKSARGEGVDDYNAREVQLMRWIAEASAQLLEYQSRH